MSLGLLHDTCCYSRPKRPLRWLEGASMALGHLAGVGFAFCILQYSACIGILSVATEGSKLYRCAKHVDTEDRTGSETKVGSSPFYSPLPCCACRRRLWLLSVGHGCQPLYPFRCARTKPQRFLYAGGRLALDNGPDRWPGSPTAWRVAARRRAGCLAAIPRLELPRWSLWW